MRSWMPALAWRRLWVRSHFCPVKCQPWCLAGSVSEGRWELAALALHRMSEALCNFLLSRSPSCLEPTPCFVLPLASLERCLAVLQLSGQQTHPITACSRLWNCSAGWGWGGVTWCQKCWSQRIRSSRENGLVKISVQCCCSCHMCGLLALTRASMGPSFEFHPPGFPATPSLNLVLHQDPGRIQSSHWGREQRNTEEGAFLVMFEIFSSLQEFRGFILNQGF